MSNETFKPMIIFGTRPEIIKLHPLIAAMQSDPDIQPIVCSTGQHRELMLPILELFSLTPDLDLSLMEEKPDLNSLTSLAIKKIGDKMKTLSPNLTVVHGDTATTLAASIASYQNQIPIAHVEAGLRTSDILSPWPEEGNRRMVSAISSLHFAPTQVNYDNLISEGINSEHCFITGNTVIDAIQGIHKKITSDQWLLKKLKYQFEFINPEKQLVLVTAHRRENFGPQIREICSAIKEIASSRQDCEFVYPVHLNPNIFEPVYEILSKTKNVHLIKPVNYEEFVFLMGLARFIMTDSGGIQEEGPALAKPVLLLRENTERPEAVEAGCVKLIGTNRSNIVRHVTELLEEPKLLMEMASGKSPYGDGNAAKTILSHLKNFMRGQNES
jgi:UDP-N-acetylglucosamine 2-epimerase (non-hydrolysing)